MFTWLEDLILQQWLRTLGWAAGIALAVHVLGALAASVAARGAAGAAAIALAFMAAHSTIGGIPSLPPAERWQWSAWIALAALLLLFLEASKGGGATLRFVLELALVAGLAWFVLLPSSTARDWSDRTRQVVLVGGGLGTALLLVVSEASATRGPSWRPLLAFTIATAGAVATLAEGSDKLARAMAGLAAGLFPGFVVGTIQRYTSIAKTAVSVATLAFGSLLVYAWAAQLVPPVSAVLLVASWVSGNTAFTSGSPWRVAAVSALLAGIPAGIAWFIATPVS
jgi:hypothetical protein